MNSANEYVIYVVFLCKNSPHVTKITVSSLNCGLVKYT
jgi:hypothetical protein